MENVVRLIKIVIILMLCLLLVGCGSLQERIEVYSSDKDECFLNSDNIAEFTYQSRDYTILEETVTNADLGEWIGYIRKLVVVDDGGKILLQEDAENISLHTLSDLADNVIDNAYIIPLLNIYSVPDDSVSLIVDTNGSYHKAIPSDMVKDNDTIYNFKTDKQLACGKFSINSKNVTQICCNNLVYQVTSEVVSEDILDEYLDIIAVHVVFDVDTKKALSYTELLKVDWDGTSHKERENWMYKDVYSISGIDRDKAVAVNINDKYVLAKVE